MNGKIKVYVMPLAKFKNKMSVAVFVLFLVFQKIDISFNFTRTKLGKQSALLEHS